MIELTRLLGASIREELPGVGSAYRVLEQRSGEHPRVSYRFVLYDFWPVIFTYDRGLFGFGIDHGNLTTALLTSEDGAFDLNDIPTLVREVDRRVRLRIPPAYMDEWERSE